MAKNNILIVDDDKITTILLNNLLKDDYNPFVLNEVEINIVDFIKDNEISLILLDIEMPVKNGFEVAKEIKSDEKTKQIPIIFLTANTEEEFILKAFENDADDYVKKPFNKQELKARIKTHISNYNYIKQIKEQQEIIYAQAMNIGMNDMLVKISHHWRQPLSVISLSAQSLNIENKMGTLQKDTVEHLTNDIVSTVTSLSENINFFSDMYAYKSNISTFNPSKQFEYIVVTIKELFNDKFLEINFTKNLNTNESFDLDVNALKNVLVNVVSNSIDAYDSKSNKNLIVDVDISDDEENFIIVLKDYAGGIDVNKIDKVFDAYYSTKDSLNGTGLGLFISKNVVKNELKGSIDLENFEEDNKKGLKVTIKTPMTKTK